MMLSKLQNHDLKSWVSL